MVYNNESRYLLICKDKGYYEDLFEYHFRLTTHLINLKFARDVGSFSFIDAISKKGLDIRKNIIDNNRNPYYWKELKKKIEVMDLNFLEFHADTMKMCLGNSINDTSFNTTTKYKQESENKIRQEIKQTQNYLDEVKYAISNLSTPSHTHDEAILQKETEKVNDRILMLSFIAMAVSAIGMMRSEDIDVAFKVISGIGIFSLPLIYYMVRDFQKKISLRKNEQNEWK